MLGFLKKKWKEIVITLVCVIAVVVTIVLYSISTSKHIFDESAAHLDELAAQINDKFGVVAKSNVDTLNAIKHHINYSIDHLDTEDGWSELDRFLTSEKKARSLTDIVFLSGHEEREADGGYVIRCKSGLDEHVEKNLHFRRSLRGLLEEQKAGILCEDEQGKLYLMFAANYQDADNDANCNHMYNYDGFSYYSMGFLYDAEEMSALLKVDAFDGKGICYITRANGLLILQVGSPRFSNNNSFEEITNYLDFLGNKNVIEIKNTSIEQIRKDFADSADGEDQNADTILIYDKEVGVEYYLTYQPIGFDDWMFIGLVPSKVINASMNSFRTQTILVITIIFVLIGAVVVWYGRRRLCGRRGTDSQDSARRLAGF